jgi:N utilization substance protein B
MEGEAGPPRVRSRTLAREAALQAVYSVLQGGPPRSEALALALARHHLDEASEAYAGEAFDGVLSRASGLDELFSHHLKRGWTPDRLALIERLILRLAAWELFHRPGIPPKVTITEAIRLAKRFGDAGSARFIHGVLGSVAADSPKAAWKPEDEEAFQEDRVEAEDLLEEVDASEGSEELQELQKGINWAIRTDR